MGTTSSLETTTTQSHETATGAPIRPVATIDLRACRKCHRCTKVCPLRPSGIRVDHSDPRCQGCLRCYSACRNHAVRLTGSGTALAAAAAASKSNDSSLQSAPGRRLWARFGRS